MRTLLITGLVAMATLGQSPANFGIFSTARDVGGPTINGATAFDPATRQYTITGSGANMWAKADQFQYVWKEMTGNFTAAATVQFVGQGAEHRKAGIVVRQSLDTDAVYADVVVHGNGMPALQWRSKKGDDTDTFDLPVEGSGTFRVKLVRTGARIQMFVVKNGKEPKEIGSTQVTFQGPVLVGLGVCSHDPAVSETAIFSDVSVEAMPAAAAQKKP